MVGNAACIDQYAGQNEVLLGDDPAGIERLQTLVLHFGVVELGLVTLQVGLRGARKCLEKHLRQLHVPSADFGPIPEMSSCPRFS